MNMHQRTNRRPGRPHNRGSVYILILGVSVLVMVIGVSGLIASRLTHRIARNQAETPAARVFAVSAIDRGLLIIQESGAGWRAALVAGAPNEATLDGGTHTLQVTDPIDGDVTNNDSDPVILNGIGVVGQSKQMMRVTLSGSGKVMSGSWKQMTE